MPDFLTGHHNSDRPNARRTHRAPSEFQFIALIRKDGKEIGQTVWTVDVSEAGARIKFKGVLVPGQTIQLLPAEDSLSAYPCRVVWSIPAVAERLGEAGLEFKTPWNVSQPRIDGKLARA